ncbi:acetylxylan esterase [Acrocarpospora phusangensis]|uniref:Acetylxylan esterase n=1 Tax=Acrocarpospora phusangensis TaxID=1070424 RepID=A0A919ULL0_9ACTN|nr:acetylxylan esterase [Acrocarpospora phusangensis]GIH26296.1 acetylxylan esterase [Acrocarpospora phusangensis]
MFSDIPAADLESYRPDLPVPADLDDFWKQTLADAARHPLGVTATEVTATPLRLMTVYDVTFAGFGGHPIKAWYLLPREPTPAAATIVEFIGYGGGRGLPHELLFWSAAGHPHLIMDTRGQGSAWRTGDTADSGSPGTPHVPGFLTDGLPDRDHYYYRRLFTDAVRAVDAAALLPGSDPGRLVTTGTSQGGALSLVTASLHTGVAAAMPHVPFLCHIRHSAQVATTGPYPELVKWCHTHRGLADQAFRALAYFDVATLAAAARCPAHFGVALRDETCPASGVYACVNRYGGPKDVVAYEWNGHEGGEAHHLAHQHRWLTETLS